MPFLRWVGGKRKLADFILSTVEGEELQHTPYVEPFVGSGAVLLRLQERFPPSARAERRASDLNGAVIATLRTIRDDPAFIVSRLGPEIERLNRMRHRDRRVRYSELVTTLNDLSRSPQNHWREIGATFALINRICFNGVFRENQAGKFNVPLGKPATGDYSFDETLVWQNSALLQGVRLRTQCYRAALKDILRQKRRWLVYLDPPYGAGGFTGYNATGFNWSDQEYLADLATELVEKGHIVIASNDDDCSVAALYDKGLFEHRQVRRYAPVSGIVGGRRGYAELVVVGGLPC
jgi:DNA adenine methylase